MTFKEWWTTRGGLPLNDDDLTREEWARAAWNGALRAASEKIAGLTDGDSPAHDAALVDAIAELDKLWTE